MPPDPSLAKPEPPVTMMLSHFSGGNPDGELIYLPLKMSLRNC